MNAAELKCCTACRRSYIVCAPLDYIDSGLCTPCENAWLHKNLGADAALFHVNKYPRPDQWSALLYVWLGLASLAIVLYGIQRFTEWLGK